MLRIGLIIVYECQLCLTYHENCLVTFDSQMCVVRHGQYLCHRYSLNVASCTVSVANINKSLKTLVAVEKAIGGIFSQK